MDIVQVTQAVHQAFLRMQEAGDKLQEALLIDQHCALWAYDYRDETIYQGHPAREAIAHFLQQFEYQDTQNPKEILLMPGIVACSESTLEAVRVLNDRKRDFKQTVLLAKDLKKQACHGEQDMRKLFSEIGLSRVHLKQCYRIIPVLERRPEKISWTWANTRSIRRISVAQARDLLMQRGDDLGIMSQLQKLSALSAHEPLAIIQELAPHLRANIVFHEGLHKSRKMIKGPVPFFYPHSHQELCAFTPPGPKVFKCKERPARKDTQIHPEPFLPAIHAHRYLQHQRSVQPVMLLEEILE